MGAVETVTELEREDDADLEGTDSEDVGELVGEVGTELEEESLTDAIGEDVEDA